MEKDVQSPTQSELDAFNEAMNRTEELNLPPPLQIDRTNSNKMSNLVVMGRKRTIEEAINPSSDLPMFSSDDLSASLETYSSQKRKRQYERHWWDSRKAPLPTDAGLGPVKRKRSPFTRHDDSGIWINSDELEPTTEEETSYTPTTSFNERDHASVRFTEEVGKKEGLECIVTPYWQHQPKDKVAFNARQIRASKQILAAVDVAAETIDLSFMDLDVLLSSTLRPLQLLTRRLADWVTPVEVAFQSLVVQLSLIVTGNYLRSLPGEVYKLSNLTILSARLNRLTEISPSIANLQNLHELNLSMNELRYLPFEILELCRGTLTGLRIQANPFLEPFPRNWKANTHFLSDEAFLKWLHAKGPALRARSTVAYFDAYGKVCRGSSPAPSRTQEHIHLAESLWTPSDVTRVPSLAELCLRSCQGSTILEDFALNPANEEDLPETIIPLLQEAWMTRDAGEKQCSVCKRSYIIPRTEWLEWWSHFTTYETMPKPFIRRGCTWACVPEQETLPDEWINCGWGSSHLREEVSLELAQTPEISEDPTRINIPRIWPTVARELRLHHGARAGSNS